ncbi:MAG: DUF2752 domain-containing protein [Acidimicrobiales bacterium]
MSITTIPFLQCPLLALTGLDCPFCGGTRATLQLAQGDVAAALDFNLVWVLVAPLVAYLVGAWVLARLGGPRLPAFVITPRVQRAAFVALLAFMVVRNLPIAPFSALKA